MIILLIRVAMKNKKCKMKQKPLPGDIILAIAKIG